MGKYLWMALGVGIATVSLVSCQSLDQQVLDVLQAAVNNGTLTETEATKFASVWLDFSSKIAQDWLGTVGGLLGAVLVSVTGGSMMASRQIKKAVVANGGTAPTK